MAEPERELDGDATPTAPPRRGELVGQSAAEPGAERDAEGDQEAESEHAPEPIRIGHRFITLGETGRGKSELLLNLFAVYKGQRILIDVQDHYSFGPDAIAEDPPPLEVDDPRAIDWSHRTIRYIVRRPGDRVEMEALHHAIFRRGRIFVACDEAEDVAPSQGGGSPPHVRKCLKQGRKVAITYAAASQRPFGVDRSVLHQSEHAAVFPMSDRDDLNAIRGRLGMTVDELFEALNSLEQYEYLRHTKGSFDSEGRPLVIRMPALPADTIDFTRRHVINPYYTQGR
jgi:hypothetical protein